MNNKLFEDVDYYHKKLAEESEVLRSSVDDLIIENNDLQLQIKDLENKIDELNSELDEYKEN